MSKLAKLQRGIQWGWNFLKWRMLRSSLPRSSEGKTQVHIGCGTINAAGYINIDARSLPHVHFRIRNLRDLNFIPEASVDLIYMCHVLEHVPTAEVERVLRVLGKRLRPGGVLRLSVPDFDKMLTIYASNGNDIRSILGPLMGGQDYAYNFHYVAFTKDYLSEQLLSNGFTSVRHWPREADQSVRFDDWSSRPITIGEKTYPISLNLEGVRA